MASLFLLDQEHVSTVLRPAGLAVLPAEGPLLAERDERDPVTPDALRDQIVHRGLRAAIAERRLYASVPRSSQCPSISRICFGLAESHLALASRIFASA